MVYKEQTTSCATEPAIDLMLPANRSFSQLHWLEIALTPAEGGLPYKRNGDACGPPWGVEILEFGLIQCLRVESQNFYPQKYRLVFCEKKYLNRNYCIGVCPTSISVSFIWDFRNFFKCVQQVAIDYLYFLLYLWQKPVIKYECQNVNVPTFIQ